MAGVFLNVSTFGVGRRADYFFKSGVESQLKIRRVNRLFVLAGDLELVEKLHSAVRPAHPAGDAVPFVYKIGKRTGGEVPEHAEGRILDVVGEHGHNSLVAPTTCR